MIVSPDNGLGCGGNNCCDVQFILIRLKKKIQVTFCHSGMNKVDFKTKAFLYTGAMKSWLTPLLNVQQLDAEAEEFQTIAGKK